MGIRASFQVIRPEMFERLIGGTGPVLVDGEEYHSIDKAWREFHSVFKTLGPPLSLAITGDHRRPECPQTFEEFRAGSDEYYVGLVSPKLVREVAAALSTLTLEEYKGLDYELHHEDFSFGDRCLPILKDVYASAAVQGSAIMVIIG